MPRRRGARPGWILLLLLFLTGTVALACDQYLDENPTGLLRAARLVGFEMDPDSINVTDASQSATGRTRVDAPAGVDSVRVSLVGPAGLDTASCGADSVAVQDGDIAELDCTITLTPADTTGDWLVDRLVVHIAGSEPLDLGAADLETAGYAHTLRVARDRTDLVTLAFDPDTAVVTNTADTVQVSIELLHAGAPIDSVSVALEADADGVAPACVASEPAGGDRFDGLWTCDLTIPVGAASGPRRIAAVRVAAGSHEPRIFDADAVQLLGQEDRIQIIGAEAALSVTLNATPDPVAVDSTLSHTVVITNLGPEPVTDLRWTLVVGGDVLISAPGQEGCTDLTSTDPPSKLFDCTLASLDPDASRSFRLDVVPQQAGEVLVSTVRLESWSGAVDPDSTDNTAVDSTTVQSANQPPTATITSPADGATYVSGDTIVFQGSGSDPEDGALSGASLAWNSDLDGALGTGATLAVADLSVGTHTIALTAIDADGATGSDAITVTVQPVADLAIAVTAAPDPVDVDSTLSHEIVITNNGPAAATDIAWSLLVEGDVLISAPNQEGCSDLTSTDPPSKLFMCSLASLDAGASQSFLLDVVPQLGGETLVSTARIDGVSGAADPNFGNNIDVDSTVVQGANQPPTATITSPADSSVFPQEYMVTLEGTGSDPEEGVLPGTSLTWTSDIDGTLGTGDSLGVTTLSPGTHTITLTATDSAGLTGTDSVAVTIAMYIGNNHQDSIAGPGDTDRFAFQAGAGDVINVAYLNETLDGRVYLTLLDSAGTQLRRVRSPVPLYGRYVETGLIELPAAGWYFIEVSGVDAGSAGTYWLGLSRVYPPTAMTLATPYADASGFMSVIGQRQYFSFEGSANAVMNFAALTPSSDVYVHLYVCSPDTTPFWDRSCFTDILVNGGSGETGRQVLPTKGTYILEVRNTGLVYADYQGAYDVRAFLPALTPINMDQTYTDSVSPAFDLDRFSVTLSSDVPAFLVRTRHTYSGYINTRVFSDPNTQVAWNRSSTPPYSSASSHEVGPLLLPAGTYQIEQDASGAGITDYTFNVVTIEPPIAMTDSSQVTGSIDQAGERDYYTFAGTAGQQLEVRIATGTDYNGYLRVYPLPADGDFTSRDGTLLTEVGYDAVTLNADTVTLPTDTTYVIEVDGGRYGIGGATGQYQLSTNLVPATTSAYLYIAVESDNAIALVDPATHTVVDSITVPQWPWAVAMAPDGSEVYAASRTGAFTIIDAATNTLADTISGVASDPFDLAVTPDGATVYVLDNNVGRAAIIDVASRSVTGYLLGATSLPDAIVLDANADTAFVAATDTVVAFDLATQTPVDTLGAAFNPADAVLTADGTELLITDIFNDRVVVVDRASLTVVDSVIGLPNPRGIALSADGATAWVAARDASTLVPIDLATHTAGTGISLPFQPYWVAISADGTTAYVTEGRGGTRLAVIDLGTSTVTAVTTLGDGPAQIGTPP